MTKCGFPTATVYPNPCSMIFNWLVNLRRSMILPRSHFLKLSNRFPLVCPTGFQCDVKRCIPHDWRCDGHVDCADRSDELNCRVCKRSGDVHCGNQRCISQAHMCDGRQDCPWGQDERNCCECFLFLSEVLKLRKRRCIIVFRLICGITVSCRS